MEATSSSLIHLKKRWGEIIDGQSPFPIGALSAVWPAYGARLLKKRECGLLRCRKYRVTGKGLDSLWGKRTAVDMLMGAGEWAYEGSVQAAQGLPRSAKGRVDLTSEQNSVGGALRFRSPGTREGHAVVALKGLGALVG